jgi:hypothetical protein
MSHFLFVDYNHNNYNTQFAFYLEIEMCVRSMDGWLYFVHSGSLNGMAHCSPVPCRPTSKVLTRKERKTKANIFVIKLI